MTRRLITGALIGAMSAAFSAGAAAQANPQNTGYWISVQTPPETNVWRSGNYGDPRTSNLCWRAGYWTPAMAIVECDPDLVPKPPPPAPAVQKITLASKALFDFDKAVLKPEGKAAIDTEIIAKLRDVQKLELVLVTGHTDRIGTQAYNQKLSERRADAVRDYLVSKGVARDKIETLGMGKTQPVPGVVCNQKAMKELIACLAPNRRVEVEVKGEAIKR
ncbi:MAG TPA: OmpA family protein [Casimicrobiaceae bacterium]|nr:OmpA family protein [Casimicrobiaceae bacterium]